tara:strand:+ start:84 stop:284 length:201 start_codon:yes stop_codon:yes gene_type:complete
MSDDMMSPTVIQQQTPESKYTLELCHMKAGSNLVLAIKKLRVSGDDLSTVMSEMKDALNQFNQEMN